MMKEIQCPVPGCGLKVDSTAWPKHVYAHKLEYCRKVGKPDTYVNLVNWHDVVGLKIDSKKRPGNKLTDWLTLEVQK